jgi:hypothetical protein
MPNIYIRTGPFDDAPESQRSFGDASDPWAAFPDAPPQAPAYASDPWAAFPDWPPAQAQFGDINPFAGSPDTPWSLPTSPLPSNAPWSVNELPPTGALFAAPKSFGQAAPQLAGDPWAAFPDWPPAQALANGSDPWAMFPDWPPTQMPRESSFVNGLLAPDALPSAPTSQAASNLWAAFSDVPPHFAGPEMDRDPWAEFPDWPPNFTAPSNANSPRAVLPARSLTRYARAAGPFTPVQKPNNIQSSGSRGDNMSHCLPSYVLCQEYHGSGPLISGKHCGDCLNMCRLNGYWPSQYCPL